MRSQSSLSVCFDEPVALELNLLTADQPLSCRSAHSHFGPPHLFDLCVLSGPIKTLLLECKTARYLDIRLT